MEGERGTVCVTGGTGYLASWLIVKLLEQGYSVNTTVRPHPDGNKDISYLTGLPGAKERLQIFKADLNEPESFNEAIEGCAGVLHLAHSLDLVDREPEEIATKRSVEGTLGILKACLNSKTVKRVVYTSSAAAIMFSGNGQEVVDESAWTDIDYFKDLKLTARSYTVSKTKTERAALEFAEQHGLDLVTLIPSLVLGPFNSPRIPASFYVGLAMIMGNRNLYRLLMESNMVHVEDVAMAHIFLLEYPGARGRYICSSDRISLNGMSEFLSARYPDLQIPTKESLKDITGYKQCGLSSKKLLDCGFRFEHGLEDMFDGAIQSCKERGFI